MVAARPRWVLCVSVVSVFRRFPPQRMHSAAKAATDGCSKKSFDQPAKLAGRVLAPGDGLAEPGVETNDASEPTKCGDR